ncbi:MAG: hypothetical protein LBG13_00785 [Holosporales bacterium]|jgi:transaldolase|nr:hypothetical protein [Holosporales bacterium]
MKLYVSSIIPEEILLAKDLGGHGIITNPTDVSRAKKPWREAVREAAELWPECPIHLQLADDGDRTQAAKQVDEFYEVLGSRLIVKMCIGKEVLSLIPYVKKLGLKANITGIVTLAQAFVAVQSGANFVSVYLGRAENVGIDSIEIIRQTRNYIDREKFDCNIVAASIKSVSHFVQATCAGANYSASTYDLLQQLIKHDVTDKSVIDFRKSWESIPGNNKMQS